MTSESAPHTRRWAARLLGVGLFATFLVTLFLGREVVLDLEQQRSASSDNVQWTHTQIEVEYLTFLNAVEHVANGQDREDRAGLDLVELRRQFDVFYSRVDTIQRSPLFADLRKDPQFGEPLKDIQRFLDGAVPTIDSDDAALLGRVPALKEVALALQPRVRQLSVAGLTYFATVSDTRRLETADTLIRLAILTSTFFLALAGLSVYLMFVNRVIQKRGEELRQTNQRMNMILSTSLDAVIVVDAEGRVLEFNSAAEGIFGYSFEEAQGKPIGDLVIPPRLRPAHERGMARMRAGGEHHVVGKGRVQLEAMRSNGEIFPVELALQSAFDSGEEIVIGFIRDISRRVADEKELISARDRALAGEKAKADFLTVMSHEIRTPLNGVLGNLALLKNARPTRDQSQFIRNMEASGKVLLRHVDSVLDIARFEAGKLTVVKETVNLSDLMQELVDAQSGYAATRGNAIEWQWIGEAAPWVTTDTQRLKQILLNLVGNAIKFTENGRISLELECADSDPSSAVVDYEFRIIDTGVGIAAENIDKVFEDFHTHDSSLGRTSEGTGLGLGIAQRFAKALGGEIGVESEPGEGSVFWLRLPLSRAKPQNRRRRTRKEVPSRPHALDLLVVEDNEINLEVIRSMLEADGHKVTVRQDGKSGVEAAAAHRYDAILMDISMPVMDGLTATRRIRAGSGKSARTPILAVSANVLPDAVDSFREAGMNAFIGKPISQDVLREVLAEATGRRHVADAAASQIEELREGLGSEAMTRLLNRFVEEADALVDTIPEARDAATLAAECHKVAGSAAVFGAMEFRDALIALENALRSDDDAHSEPLRSRVVAVWADTRPGLPV